MGGTDARPAPLPRELKTVFIHSAPSNVLVCFHNANLTGSAVHSYKNTNCNNFSFSCDVLKTVPTSFGVIKVQIKSRFLGSPGLSL